VTINAGIGGQNDVRITMMMMMMMIMMIVDLYSALCRAPLLRYVSQCIVKRNVMTVMAFI